MATIYPTGIDNNISLPQSIDLITPIKAEVTNRLRDAIIAIESELGIDPSREYGTIRARLDALSNLSGSGGSGSVGILDDGSVILTTAKNINFIGPAVTVTDAGSCQADVEINPNAQIFQETIAVDGGDINNFTLSYTPNNPNAVQMYINGQKVQYGQDYIVNNDVVTYIGTDYSLLLTDDVEFYYIISGAFGGGGAYVEYIHEEISVTTPGQTAFLLSNTPASNVSVLMFVNKLKIELSQYTVVGTNVTYSGPLTLLSTDTVEFYYPKTDVTVVSSQSLSDVLINGNITNGNDIIISNGDSIVAGGSVINLDGYVDVSQDLTINGKLNVAGLIDPTGMVFDHQSTVPSGNPSTDKSTLWVRNDGYIVLTDENGQEQVFGTPSNLAETLVIGNTTGGNDIVLSALDALTAETTMYIEQKTGNSNSIYVRGSTTDANDIYLQGGGAVGSDIGGKVDIQGGDAITGFGGSIYVDGGNSSEGSGGGVYVSAGDSIEDFGGSITFSAGAHNYSNNSGSYLQIQGARDNVGGGIYIDAGKGPDDAGSNSADGGEINISAGVAHNNPSYNANGGEVNIGSGRADESGNGGDISIYSGRGGTTSGDGGDIDIFTGSGAGGGSNGNGGDIDIFTGTGEGTGDGGKISIFTGAASDTGNGGDILLIGGLGYGAGGQISLTAGAASTNGGTGGQVYMKSGDADGTNAIAGNVSLLAGDADGSGGTPGSVFLNAGNYNAVTGSYITLNSVNSVDGYGGNVTIGSGEPIDGYGGYITLLTADSGEYQSGNVEIITGDGYSSGIISLTTGNGISSVSEEGSGNIELLTGSATKLVGDISLFTGYAESGGNILIEANKDFENTVAAGHVFIAAGNSTAGQTPGDLTIQSGTDGSDVRGNVRLATGNSTSGSDSAIIMDGSTGDITIDSGHVIAGTISGDVTISTSGAGIDSESTGSINLITGTSSFCGDINFTTGGGAVGGSFVFSATSAGTTGGFSVDIGSGGSVGDISFTTGSGGTGGGRFLVSTGGSESDIMLQTENNTTSGSIYLTTGEGSSLYGNIEIVSGIDSFVPKDDTGSIYLTSVVGDVVFEPAQNLIITNLPLSDGYDGYSLNYYPDTGIVEYKENVDIPLVQVVTSSSVNLDVPASGQELIVLVDSNTIGVASTLYLPSSPNEYSYVIVKDIGNNASSYNINIDPGSNEIDGVSSAISITADSNCKKLFCYQNNWYVIGDFTTP